MTEKSAHTNKFSKAESFHMWLFQHFLLKWNHFSIFLLCVNVSFFIFCLTKPGNHRISSQHCPLPFCCDSPTRQSQIKQRLITIKSAKTSCFCAPEYYCSILFPHSWNRMRRIMTAITLFCLWCSWYLVPRVTAPQKKKETRRNPCHMVKLTHS